MPFADPEKQKAYFREYDRLRRKDPARIASQTASRLRCAPKANELARERHAKNMKSPAYREKKKATALATWNRLPKEKKKMRSFAGTLRQYGITPDQFNDMLKKQGGVCAICRQPCPRNPRLSVDHCHQTGRVRGLLCSHCNVGLGHFRHDHNRLRSAITYLTSD